MASAWKPDREPLKLNLARIKKGKRYFEISIDVVKAFDYLNGRNPEIRDVLRSEAIYKDARRGMKASEKELIEAFGTKEPLVIADYILHKGEVQETAEHRKQQAQNTMNQIVDILHRNGVDPKTGRPHPAERIKRAIAQAKARIDPRKSAQEQVRPTLKALMPILPIKFETKEIELHIPTRYAPSTQPRIKHFGRIIKSQWEQSGSWHGVIELPGGLEGEFYDTLNALTHGNSMTRVLRKS